MAAPMNLPIKRQRGLALITAVLIVAIAVMIASFVAFGQQLWLRRMQNVSDRTATDILDRGALHWASAVLIDDARKSGNIDHLGEQWAMPLPALPVEGGAIRVAIEDAQGRFNLNNVWRNGAPSTADVAVLRRLLTLLRLDPVLTEPLLDWIDPDDNARPQGAEDVDYLNGQPPYRAANQPLTSVDELRLIRGYTAKTVEVLRPYVTVLPVPTDININTASPLVLAALIPGLDLDQAGQIARARQDNPFQNVAAFARLLPTGISAPQSGIGVKSGYFLVMLETAIGRHERRAEALLARSSASTTVLWYRPQPLINAGPPINADEQQQANP